MRFLIFFVLCVSSLSAQEASIDQLLFNAYDQYKESSIRDRRFKHQDIHHLMSNLEHSKAFDIVEKGRSIEGKSIKLVSIGKGETAVLLWSQMHGDESTATMAIMDIFNFLSASDEFDDLRTLLQEELRIHFIPMLNPDGADRFQRRNALNIDLNRDALRLQCPESRILKEVRDSLDAVWGFNLHDQNRYYAAGINNPHTASISFLAPAYNYEKDINQVRGNAMKLIAEMNSTLQKYIPNKVAKYNDDFEPRAFGDNIQKWGTSTILIESGGLIDDREKQYLRKLHFVTILSALKSIADKSYEARFISEYNEIPFNESNTFAEFLIRNASVKLNDQDFIIDIALRKDEVQFNHANDYYFKSFIQDIGDLSIFYGYEEFDAKGYQAEVGKVYPKRVKNIKAFNKLNWKKLLGQGYTCIQMDKIPSNIHSYVMPFQIVKSGRKIDLNIHTGKNPTLLFRKDGQVSKIIVNGVLFDYENDKEGVLKGIQKLKT